MTADDRMAERMRVVVALTEVNASRLRWEAKQGGVEIERARCVEDHVLGGGASDLADRIAALDARLAELNNERTRLEDDHQRLLRELAALEAADGKGGSP